MDGAIKLMVKPLSVNQVWQGKRFKTPAYKSYEKLLLLTLPDIELPQPPFTLHLEFGVSSSLSDWDNPIKPFQDVLQKRYGFDDKNIMVGIVHKVRIPKGEEYISFKIEHYEESID